jgi:toxin ParE1/3/4
MGRYLLTDSAKADIREIVDYIRQRSPAAATRVRTELRDEMRRLADFPRIGHRRLDLAAEHLRFWSVYSYLIIYLADTRPLQIIRVLHGARDVKRILEDEPEKC